MDTERRDHIWLANTSIRTTASEEAGGGGYASMAEIPRMYRRESRGRSLARYMRERKRDDMGDFFSNISIHHNGPVAQEIKHGKEDGNGREDKAGQN